MHVVATAGHVDHGKSRLVRALTGMEPDRLAEERRRGLTIDLGFAWTTLPRSGEVSFVDVPGHQRFIANMLAGLGPAPVVLFVVAADEGWSAQSSEHLAAIDALAIRHGVLAVTRSDLADPGPVLHDARARVACSSLGDLAGVAVSGATGQGVPELRNALDLALAQSGPALDTGRVRLWIDRSFAVRGAGTVVTGTLGAGAISVGDVLEFSGAHDAVGARRPRRVRVRGIQTNGTQQARCAPTARVALNLRDVDHHGLGRGAVLLTPTAWHLTDAVDVRLAAADGVPDELILHVGTAAVPVHVRPLASDVDVARLRLARELPLCPGDRGVLRDPGQQRVAAGVEVLDVAPPPLTRRGAAAARAKELPTTGLPSAGAQVLRRQVVARAELARLGIAPEAAAADTRVRIVGELLVAEPAWQAWVAALRDVVTGWPARDPLQPHPSAAAARDEIGLPRDPTLWAAVVEAAGVDLLDGRLALADSALADSALADSALADSAPAKLPGAAAELAARLAADPFAAPARDELAALGLGRRELAAAAKGSAVLVLGGDLVLAPDAAQRAAQILAGLPQPFTVSAARQALGSTRRVVVPLLEYLDELGHTTRVDATTRRVR